VQYKNFPSQPLQHKLAAGFFQDVKANRIDMVNISLKDEPYLIFEYDNNEQTALHWAAKRYALGNRNYYEILLILINSKADLNAKDLVHLLTLAGAHAAVPRRLQQLPRHGEAAAGLRRRLLPRAQPQDQAAQPDHVLSKPSDYVIRAHILKAQKLGIKMGLLPIYKKHDFWKKNCKFEYRSAAAVFQQRRAEADHQLRVHQELIYQLFGLKFVLLKYSSASAFLLSIW